MGRWLALGVLAAMVSACGSFSPSLPGDPARLVIGVSAARPAAGTAAPQGQSRKILAWKIGQICTHGATRLRQDFDSAEQGRQFVDWQFRCTPYHLAL